MGALRYKCLVLDHDDTVMNSTAHVHHPSFLVALRELRPGLTMDLDTYFRINFDPGFLPYCENVLGFTPEEFDRELQIWQGYVKEHIPEAFAGVREIIEEQFARGGYVCVASHSFKHNILRDYAANGLPEPTLVYGWELPREKRKPNPYALDEIMRILELRPDELLMVDDLKPGYDMAKQRNVPFAAAGWAYDIAEIRDFLKNNCPLYFDTPDALYRYLFE